MKPTRRGILGVFAASLPVAGIAWAGPPPAGRVEAIRGAAFALREAVRRPLAAAADLFVGEQVATGARSALAMRLGAATLIRLGADTTLKIDRYLINAGGILELGQGAMVFDRDEAAPKADLAVRSPFGLIAVRGTRFFAGPSNGVFGVFVERGLVMVVGASTAVEVGPGLGTDIAAPGGEPTPSHPWGPARIAAAFASVE
jgi:hypothetical protein